MSSVSPSYPASLPSQPPSSKNSTSKTIPGLAKYHVLKDFATVAVWGSIYIIGSRLYRKEGGSGDGDEVVETDHEVLPNVWRYNVINDEWCHCAPLGTPRLDFACTVSEGKIYVAGGQCMIGSARGISSAEVYDPMLDEWNKLPNMSTFRYKFVGVTWQGKIYVVGGFAEREDFDRSVLFRTEMSSAKVFDIWRGEWDLKQGMWKLEVPPNQIVVVDDKLYSSGDCLNTWKGVTTRARDRITQD
ncbi:Kelch repeat type 1 [Cinnamomum micranthum f. kanehirae]|uniref:Kelch repeat type 1 n=1 Tax=Cinnamomum micranthum f. kanehirae TaxID=337451 RepID=A0A3S3NEM1_9MAGN|nr:Kelch repeat type 1 [Cinnamomum micranthum f. kanehirae]